MNVTKNQTKDNELHSTRILIVDDEAFQRTVLETYVSKFGYRVCLAASGAEAIDFCQSLAPDLILLDLKMPGMNGIQTCQQLVSLSSLKYTPIIMLTGMNDTLSIKDSYSAGAMDYLIKPVNEVLLKQRIEYAIDNAKLLKRLNQKERELDEMQKLAHVGSFELSVENRNICISSSCKGLIGLSSNELKLTFNEFLNHVHEDDRQHVIFTLENACKNKQSYIVEYRFIYDEKEYIIYQKGEYTHVIDGDNDKSYLIGSFQDVTEERNAKESLSYSRYYDSLTDLTNRAFFESQIQHILSQPPTDSLFMVAFIGLDRFTLINDDVGHEGGDEVLKEIASRFRQYENMGHTVSRFSGDVFTMLIVNLHHIEECNKFLDEILETVRDPVTYKDRQLHVTASIGSSVFPLESENGRQLLIGAEAAMMLSAEDGGNRYTYRTHHMNTETQKRLTILKEMRGAIENDEFTVYYQPQVSSDSMEIVGMEALVRWQHPEKGMISPADFIPVAEESGLIKPIGDIVTRKACNQTKKWLDMGFNLVVGINISAQQFESDDFIDNLVSIIRESEVPFTNIEVEITESMAVKNPTKTIEILDKLRNMGIKTSMDDFGTGYSSLSQLQTLPLDTLKVDQAFVKQIRKNKTKSNYDNSAIANAIIVMSHSLGLKVIAEGVETLDQCEFLQHLKSDVLQGYLFSRPIDPEEFELLLIAQTDRTASAWKGIINQLKTG